MPHQGTPAIEKLRPAVICAFISSQREAMSPLHVAVEYLCSPANPERVSKNTRLFGSALRCPL